mgnify:FL=1
MTLKIINKPDGSGYIAEFKTDDDVKVLDRWQVTTIEFENFCWHKGQFKGRDNKIKGVYAEKR